MWSNVDSIFIKGLPDDILEKDIEKVVTSSRYQRKLMRRLQMASPYGKVDSICLAKTMGTSKYKDYALVYYTDPHEAEAAIEGRLQTALFIRVDSKW